MKSEQERSAIKKMLSDKEFMFDVRKLHKKLYRSLYIQTKILHELSIEYCLTGGSHLGQLRICGILPYDDDLDLAITEPELNKFLTEDTLKRLSALGLTFVRFYGTSHYKLMSALPENKIYRGKLIRRKNTPTGYKFYLDGDLTGDTLIKMKILGKHIDFFVHKKVGDEWVYNHWDKRKSVIPCESFDNRKLVDFGPLKVYSTEFGQYLPKGMVIDEIPYRVSRPHLKMFKKYIPKDGFILNTEEEDLVKNFSFDITFDELELGM